jgi:4-alpha-glucanotransferase
MPDPASEPRLAGLLVPVFALRRAGDFGIGDTLAVKEAVDFCAAHGFAILQILPIHETVGDHSPYNPISSRALSPALLALVPEEVPGLTPELLQESAPESWLQQLRAGDVKHNSVQPLKLQILRVAHQIFRADGTEENPLWQEFALFRKSQEDWLDPYTLFRLLIREYEGNPNWGEWRPEHQTVAGAAAWLARHPDRADLEQARESFAFIQWVAWRQWSAVRAYADAKGVLLMGEMSFGVGKCSVDVWAWPELFDVEWSLGTRPLAYFDTNKDSEAWGQNWGLPPYRWENHRSSGFAWLRARIGAERQFFHICRLDHLRGYFRVYMFPWAGGARHAEFATLTEEEARKKTGGKMPRFVPGPDEDPVSAAMNDLQGREILSVLREAAGSMGLVGEIMGAIPDYMRNALDDLALYSLTFPQLERNADRSLQDPATFRRLSLVAYANHDNAPLAALYTRLVEGFRADPNGYEAIDLANLLRFAGWTEETPETLTPELLLSLQRALFNTPCQIAVLMCSDLFGIPLRFNLPGSYGADTWCDRLDFSLGEYAAHPVYGPRVRAVSELIVESGRQPASWSMQRTAPGISS